MRVTVTVTYEPNPVNVSTSSMEPTATRLGKALTATAERILREDGVTGPFKVSQEADLAVGPLSDSA